MPSSRSRGQSNDKGVVEVVLICQFDVVAGQRGYENCETVDDCVKVTRQRIREDNLQPKDYLELADDLKIQVRKGAP